MAWGSNGCSPGHPRPSAALLTARVPVACPHDAAGIRLPHPQCKQSRDGTCQCQAELWQKDACLSDLSCAKAELQ